MGRGAGGGQAFNREAIAYYMPSLEEVAERRLSRWAQQPRVAALTEFKDLAFDVATIVLISDMPVRHRSLFCMLIALGGAGWV
jgi:cytochrome P450